MHPRLTLASSAPNYALLTYPTSDNLGDEIQSIAARHRLPHVDRLLDREALDAVRAEPGRSIALILNGWFMHRPRHWPPAESLTVLPISLHLTAQREAGRIARWRPAPGEIMTRGRGAAYLRRHAPIGARDRATLALLRRRGIDAYLSGCLTLTLPRPSASAQRDYVVACDLDEAMAAAVRARTRSTLLSTTHHEQGIRNPEERLAIAQRLLDLYASAKAVVTTRLHCALPCLALGTPVLLVTAEPNDPRLAAGEELAHHCSRAALLAGDIDFQPDAPPANPDTFRPLRDGLIARCDAFVAAFATGAARANALGR